MPFYQYHRAQWKRNALACLYTGKHRCRYKKNTEPAPSITDLNQLLLLLWPSNYPEDDGVERTKQCAGDLFTSKATENNYKVYKLYVLCYGILVQSRSSLSLLIILVKIPAFLQAL